MTKKKSEPTNQKKKVVIDRATWMTGRYDKSDSAGPTYLLNGKGMMCCLGFALNQVCGVPKMDLRSKAMPRHLTVEKDLEPFASTFSCNSWGEGRQRIRCDSDLTSAASTINDDADLTDAEREAKLVKLFAKDDIELSFTGRYPSRKASFPRK